MEPKIGIYICRCEGEISNVVDVSAVADFARQLPNVVSVKELESLCSFEDQVSMKRDIQNGVVNRVVLAACSPRMYEVPIKQAIEEAGLNVYLFEKANIREQCAWSHSNVPDKATEKAKALVASAVAKVRNSVEREDREIKILDRALVIGGGVAGLEAALDLANQGFYTYLVERESELGGRAYKLSMTFPTTSCGICCMHYCKECRLTPGLMDVYLNRNVDVMTDTEVIGVDGYVGNYQITVKNRKSGMVRKFAVGTIIVATGSKIYDARRIPEYGYGEYEDVLTILDLERRIVEDRLKGRVLSRPSDGKVPKVVSFIQCVGSRAEKGGNPYCSLVCCNYALGQASTIKKMYPDCDVYIFYIDIRGPYRGIEEFYEEVREMGVKFVRGRVARVEKVGDKLVLSAEDKDLGEQVQVESDLVILSVGQEPNDGTPELAKMLNIPLGPDGFFEDLNLVLEPEERRGIYLAGCAQGPRGIRWSVADGRIAASHAAALMSEGILRTEAIVALVDEDACGGCGICTSVCPYNVPKLKEVNGRRISEIAPVSCNGCGVCASACPSDAIDMESYQENQILAQIEALAKMEVK